MLQEEEEDGEEEAEADNDDVIVSREQVIRNEKLFCIEKLF